MVFAALQSVSSAVTCVGLALQGSMRSSYLSPSPPISGRDISALAVIRRPSWSGAARTASYDGGSATAAGTQVSLTPHLSASLHDRVLYGALGNARACRGKSSL